MGTCGMYNPSLPIVMNVRWIAECMSDDLYITHMGLDGRSAVLYMGPTQNIDPCKSTAGLEACYAPCKASYTSDEAWNTCVAVLHVYTPHDLYLDLTQPTIWHPIDLTRTVGDWNELYYTPIWVTHRGVTPHLVKGESGVCIICITGLVNGPITGYHMPHKR